jgi:hypothetical protein
MKSLDRCPHAQVSHDLDALFTVVQIDVREPSTKSKAMQPSDLRPTPREATIGLPGFSLDEWQTRVLGGSSLRKLDEAVLSKLRCILVSYRSFAHSAQTVWTQPPHWYIAALHCTR